MSNVSVAINDQIRRLARREVTAGNRKIKKATAQYRRAIAALKRQVAGLVRQVVVLQKQAPRETQLPPPEAIQNARLRTDGLKAHRKRLGLSAKDYGKLLGVSALTVYSWERGKSKPRRSQLPRIVAIRGIRKRQAWERLGYAHKADTSGEMSLGSPRKRGVFTQTAQDMISGLLKDRKILSTGEINAIWKKSGRLGNADNTLSLMTKTGRLKRMKVKNGRGSQYRLV